MGFLGGDNETADQPTGAEVLLNNELETNKADLEAKKEALYQTRLDIIKSQGGQAWTPSYGRITARANTSADQANREFFGKLSKSPGLLGQAGREFMKRNHL